jgi:ribosome-binding factor A
MDSKRQAQIGELIKRNFSMVFYEEGRYIYGDAMVSITHVRVTPDLSQAKVYLSVFNTENKDAILLKITNHTHVLKQALAQRIKKQVRRIPIIHFHLDETIDEMYKVNELFAKVKTMYPESVNEEE